MADINVERKGPSIWPWIIGLIVLALLIWALAEMFGRDDRTTTAPGVVPVDTPRQPVTAPAVPVDTPFARDPAFPADTPGVMQPDTPARIP